MHFMKTSNFGTKLICGLAALLLGAGGSLRAQVPGGAGAGAMNAAISKIFGDIKAFSARADIQVLDSSKKEMANMPMDFAFSDGKVRVSMDMAQMKSSSMPQGAAEQMKKMGMAQVVSILRPDQSAAYVIYPDSKVMMKMPLPKEDNNSKDVKLQKTPLGKETLDGHPCEKNKVVIPGKGRSTEATTWNATDMKDFPIQIETVENEITSRIHFSKVQFTKPDTKDFDPPAGYTLYNSPQEMMQALMSKMGGGTEEKK